MQLTNSQVALTRHRTRMFRANLQIDSVTYPPMCEIKDVSILSLLISFGRYSEVGGSFRQILSSYNLLDSQQSQGNESSVHQYQN